MKKISIFIVILLVSLGVNAEGEEPIDSLKVVSVESIVIAIDSTLIVDNNLLKINLDFDKYKIGTEIIDKILKNEQPDMKLQNSKIVVISREKEKKKLFFIFKGINEANYNAARDRLKEGCDLVDGEKCILHVSFNDKNSSDIPVQKLNNVSSTSAGVKTDVEKTENASAGGNNINAKNTLDSDIKLEEEVILIKKTQYAIIGIAVVVLIFVIALFSSRIKNKLIREFNSRNRHLDDLLVAIEKKTQSFEKDDKRIESAIARDIMELKRKLEELVLLIPKSITPPLPQRLEVDPIMISESPQKKASVKGYIVESKIDGISDKDIQPICDEYCIYEIECVSADQAHYFINTDKRALQNILSVAYMLGDYNDETKGKQATEVRTDEYGILQKVDGRWKVARPLKFTIK